jgi:FkbM family methyltransferase
VVALTEEIVRDVYRGILNREPESDAVVEAYAKAEVSLATMLSAFVSSSEFLDRFKRSEGDLVGDGVAPGEEAVMRRHTDPGLGRPGFITNFIGTRFRAEYNSGTRTLGNFVIPDIPTITPDLLSGPAEFIGTIKAVEAGKGAFVMAELGAGLGTWSAIAGHIARKLGRSPIRLYPVEGSAPRVEHLKATMADNDFDPKEYSVFSGVVGPVDGYALFPQIEVLDNWGASPLFVEKVDVREGFDIVPCVSIPTLLKDESLVDLLHFDVQGSEYDIISCCLDTITAKTRYMVIGTHSRDIEHKLIVALKGAGWHLENEHCARAHYRDGVEILYSDGTQVWKNPKLC